ncbi:MAG: hypothetical protein EOP10_17055 [Proteobacteria bacterium]|nr:MAG: hypothetical protein EOP10_17055 [Pseudomonadota bacterium]
MSAYSYDKLRLPLVRRIFRQANVYICGLCKTEHKSYGEANSCMNQCWFDVHNFFPVVKRKISPSSWVHRCLFCCRDYTSEGEAFTCAAKCAGEKNREQLREQLLNDLPLPPPTRKTSRLLMLARVRHAPVAKKKVEVIAPVVEEKKKTEIIDLGKNKKDYKLPFVRKGEKYQCPYCRVMHFTKTECEACFGTHWKDDGYEKIRAASVDKK